MPDFPADFQKACDDLIDKWEGTTFTATPGDAGGGTKFGISSRSYPDVDIEGLTRADAEEIYYRDFWMRPGVQAITDSQMRAKVFNMGVLMGPGVAEHLAFQCSTLDEFRQACERHFQAIVARNPGDAKFLHGWTRRALA
jgi:lysozyme family protein